MSNQELQHLIHGTHKKDEPQLSDCHGKDTPQEDGRAQRMAEWHWGWKTDIYIQNPHDVLEHILRHSILDGSLLTLGQYHTNWNKHRAEQQYWLFDHLKYFIIEAKLIWYSTT